MAGILEAKGERGLLIDFAPVFLWIGAPLAPAATITASSAPQGPRTYVYGRASFATGAAPIALARGDLDGDGVEDLISANGNDDTVSVLIGTPRGSFHTRVDYRAGNQPNAVALGDLDGNGTLDLVVVDGNCPTGSCGGGSVSVLLGNGNGTFHAAVPYATNTDPLSVAIGDFDGDGVLDLAVVNAISPSPFNHGPGTVSILLGRGDGTFLPETEFRAGSGPGAIVAADLDGDGHLDLAITNFAALDGVNAVVVLRGTGHGGFQSPIAYATANGPVQLVARDLDGDGDSDLVVAARDANVVSVLRNNGNGTFQAHVDYPAGHGPIALVLADLDHDGKLDIALSTLAYPPQSGSAVILRGNGDATFQPYQEYITGLIGSSILAGLVDADSNVDLVVSGPLDHVTVLLGKGDGTLVGPTTYATGDGPASVAGCDLNDDGKLDLVVANELSGTFSVFLGNGDGRFQPHVDHRAGRQPVALLSADFNHDHRADLAIANAQGSRVSTLLGRGDGSFLPRSTFDTATDPESLTTGDFDGDGILDLAVACRNSNTISILLGMGDGSFQPRTDFSGGSGPVSVTHADFNGDGKLDLAVADANTPSHGPGWISVLLGNGDGTFGPPRMEHAGFQALAVAAGEFDGDGIPDLVVGTSLDQVGQILILLGNGDGTFRQQASYQVGRFPIFVSVGDFNRDGILDFAEINQDRQTVTIMTGDGDGSFALQASYGTGPDPASLALGDFNGDGDLDMAVANHSGSLSVFTSR